MAKHTSALCNTCRLASSRTANPVAKRQFVQSAKEVANSTANLVKTIKVGGCVGLERGSSKRGDCCCWKSGLLWASLKAKGADAVTSFRLWTGRSLLRTESAAVKPPPPSLRPWTT